jgi:hypothetical protein
MTSQKSPNPLIVDGVPWCQVECPLAVGPSDPHHRGSRTKSCEVTMRPARVSNVCLPMVRNMAHEIDAWRGGRHG